MTYSAVIDNDILMKLARYELLSLSSTIFPLKTTSFLETLLYVARDYLPEDSVALRELFEWTNLAQKVSATEEDARLSAAIVDEAQAQGLDIDPGEALLAAVAINHGKVMWTGDKRAVEGFQSLLGGISGLAGLRSAVGCLEQVMIHLLNTQGFNACRRGVCKDPGADTAVRVCFSCENDFLTSAECHDALHSYIKGLYQKAPDILMSCYCDYPGCVN